MSKHLKFLGLLVIISAIYILLIRQIRINILITLSSYLIHCFSSENIYISINEIALLKIELLNIGIQYSFIFPFSGYYIVPALLMLINKQIIEIKILTMIHLIICFISMGIIFLQLDHVLIKNIYMIIQYCFHLFGLVYIIIAWKSYLGKIDI